MIPSFDDLKSMDAAALLQELARSRERLRELRFRISQQQEKKVHTPRVIRQTIAQIQTLLRAKARQSAGVR